MLLHVDKSDFLKVISPTTGCAAANRESRALEPGRRGGAGGGDRRALVPSTLHRARRETAHDVLLDEEGGQEDGERRQHWHPPATLAPSAGFRSRDIIAHTRTPAADGSNPPAPHH